MTNLIELSKKTSTTHFTIINGIETPCYEALYYSKNYEEEKVKIYLIVRSLNPSKIGHYISIKFYTDKDSVNENKIISKSYNNDKDFENALKRIQK